MLRFSRQLDQTQLLPDGLYMYTELPKNAIVDIPKVDIPIVDILIVDIPIVDIPIVDIPIVDIPIVDRKPLVSFIMYVIGAILYMCRLFEKSRLT